MMNGMAPQYSTGAFPQRTHPRHAVPYYSPYGGCPPNSHHTTLPRYKPLHDNAQTAQSLSSPLPSNNAGVAVVIPSPSVPHQTNQRTSSLPERSQEPPSQKSHRDISTSAATSNPLAVVPSVSIRNAVPPVPQVDYQSLLLALADDYLAAVVGQDTRQHRKLIAAGLGCLEVLLKRFKLQSHTEATVRLRYATVLHQETENSLEAEQALSDGIKLCDRYRLFDLKYNMQHLLCRILFIGSPRASLKFLDGVIKDAEAYQHTAWIFAMRFLEISLHLKSSSQQDIHSAFSQTKSISGLADHLGEKSVLALASTMDAAIHLQESGSAESIEQARCSLATARGLLFDPKVQQIPPVVLLMNIVDVCCSLQNSDPAQVATKVQAMQNVMDSRNGAWQEDGLFLLPVVTQDASRCPYGSGIVQRDAQGSIAFMLNWAPQPEINALGYLLSGIANSHRNALDGFKSEQMFKEGLRCLDKNAGKDTTLEPPLQTNARRTQRQTLRCFLHVHLILSLCLRTAWTAAEQQYERLVEIAGSSSQEPETLDLLIQYLDGIIKHGTGHLENALSIFEKAWFSLYSCNPRSPIRLDLSILSTLNSILIVREPSNPSHRDLPALLASLEAHSTHINNNKSLCSAYNLILATSPHPPPTIVRTKHFLATALASAKSVANNQLQCITLNLTSYKFFKGVIGSQAQKSARASQQLASKGKDRLWQSVSLGLAADTFERAGKVEEAERFRKGGMEITRGLPEAVVKWEDDQGADKIEVR